MNETKNSAVKALWFSFTFIIHKWVTNE